MMSYKKPFLIVFTALVLSCSIPINACASDISPFDESLAYYKYNLSEEDWVSTSTSPWYDVQMGNSHIVGRVHCRGGHVNFAFILFIPLVGYYLVVSQESDMNIDFDLQNGRHAFYHVYNFDGDVQQSYYSFSGDGYLSASNRSCFQDVFFGQYFVFMQIISDASSSPDKKLRSSLSNYRAPTSEEEDDILNLIRDNSGNGKPFPSGSATAEVLGGTKGQDSTYPDGTPVPTNSNGNNAPTNEFGQTVVTLPNGMPAPTYPNGDVAETYTDGSGNTYTVPYHIYNNGNNQADVSQQFSRLNGMIADLDDLSSLMESNQNDLSSHVDDTRGLIDDVTGWLPTPVIACLVCGAIMIIAVKISGSGKS